MNYERFIFKSYDFDAAAKRLTLRYSYDDEREFTESYRFDFDFTDYDDTVLDRACQQLFFMAGVSYYKIFLAPTIEVRQGEIDQSTATFLQTTYEHGLGEFFYVNQLDPRTPIVFPVNSSELQRLSRHGEGLLVGIGGGKDSLLSIELLRNSGTNLTTWALSHRSQLTPLVERINLPHLWVEREWDRQLLELKSDRTAYNGHIPISAIFACVGTIVAILSGCHDIVVSNEQSANEPTLEYEGVAVNHQYSKSQAFETDYQAQLQHLFDDGVRYYSLLRPLSELRIAELFSPYFEHYHDVFSSCNSAFTHRSHGLTWDGTCPKCAFVFLALTPFVERSRLEALFNGKNLLLDESLVLTYEQLLGIAGQKPLECVGEIKESRAAMRLAQQQYPELKRYQFELPEDYNFRQLMTHAMPSEIWQLVQPKLA